MKSIYVYHHNDADGLSSAAVIHKYLKENYMDNEKIFHMCSHSPDELLPLSTFKKDDMVYVADYALPVDYAKALIEIGVYLVWIDHHESAIKEYEEAGMSNINGIRDYEHYESAVKLCWRYFFPSEAVPESVELISSYDTWEWVKTGNNEAKYFVYGLTLEETHPVTGSWDCFFSEDSNWNRDIIDNGEVISGYKAVVYEEMVDNAGYDVIFEEYEAKVLNAQRGGKPAFKNYYDDYVLFIIWEFNGKDYKVSLYTNNPKINVGEIARRFKGGGHAGSAGFTCSKLPF